MNSNEANTQHAELTRIPTPFESKADTRYVSAFDVGGTNTVGVLADHAGKLLAEARASTVRYQGQPEYGQVFARLRDEMLQQVGLQASQLRAATLSVAGAIDPSTGRVLLAPNLSDEAFDLGPIASEALGMPALLDNDVNLAAVGERWHGAARDCANFVFVAIGTGIGSAIFIDGRLYQGAHSAAGEIGYMYVHGPDNLESTESGPAPGALERRASGTGIAMLARERLQRSGSKAARSLLRPESVRSEDVWQAASAGDPLAEEVINETLDTLSLSLANIALLLDPELIILGGGVSQVGNALLLPLRQRLSALLPAPIAPRLELSQLGTAAQLHGAVYRSLSYINPQLSEGGTTP